MIRPIFGGIRYKMKFLGADDTGTHILTQDALSFLQTSCNASSLASMFDFKTAF